MDGRSLVYDEEDEMELLMTLRSEESLSWLDSSLMGILQMGLQIHSTSFVTCGATG